MATQVYGVCSLARAALQASRYGRAVLVERFEGEDTAASTPAAASSPSQREDERSPGNVSVIAALEGKGAEIRELKASAGQGNKEEIIRLVSELNAMKEDMMHQVQALLQPLLDDLCDRVANGVGKAEIQPIEAEAMKLINLLPSARKKAAEKGLKELKKQALAATRRKFDRKLHTQGLRVQRKIAHLLESEGSGDDFGYFRRLATAVHGLRPGQRVVLTEKWDGTTVQATNKGIFKRKDRFGLGDPRKHAATEEERYDIERVDLEHPQNRHIATSVRVYLERFNAMEPDLCVYFEAVGSNIQARFTHLPEFADIRVFDFARSGRFLPWSETTSLAKKYDLPIVAATESMLDLDKVLEVLQARPCYAGGIPAQLEGFVVRAPVNMTGTTSEPKAAGGEDGENGVCGASGKASGKHQERGEEPVAKIRIEDLGKWRA